MQQQIYDCFSLKSPTMNIWLTNIIIMINTEALAMKKVLLSQCSSSTTPNDIPAVHLLSRCTVKHAHDATKQYARTDIRLKRLKKRSKHTIKVQQNDPLMDTKDVANQRGRPRKKKAKKPPLPMRVSVDTRIKQLRAAAAKWLGKH